MGGGLLQLVAKGFDDTYLIREPQITLFKTVYRRHSNFSIFDNLLFPTTNSNHKISFVIPKHGDLVNKLYLVVDVPTITLKKHVPTFEYVSAILKTYSVNWIQQTPTMIVTTDTYYDTILPVILLNLSDLILKYNLYLTGTKINSGIKPKNDTLTNANTNFETSQIISFINTPVFNDTYVVSKILATTPDVLTTYITQGVMLGGLRALMFDTAIFNCDGDSVTNIIDAHQSVPLFGSVLSRTSVTEIKLLPVYNSDDIRFLHYIIYLNNITRLTIIDGQNINTFNPLYANIQWTPDLKISRDNIGLLNPDILTFDESIVFYHIMDNDMTSYVVYQNNIGENTNVYFDNNIKQTYDILLKYNTLLPVNRTNYTDIDAYKIYKSYMKDINNDPVNSTIKTTQQTSIIAKAIKYTIHNNIAHNFVQLINILEILKNAPRTNANNYILTFYKSYSSTVVTSDITIFTPIAGSSFVPIYGKINNNVIDYFKTIINNVTTSQITDGVVIKNYFNTDIQLKFDVFLISCQNHLRSINYDAYVNYYDMWKLLLFKGNLLSTYNNVAQGISIGTTFSKIAHMNYLPLLVAIDIPIMILDTFVSSGAQIVAQIGGSEEDLLNMIRNVTNVNILNSIYGKIVESIIVANNKVSNGAYYSDMNTLYAKDNTFLLSCSLKQETFFHNYSTIDIDGTITNVGNDVRYLALEWLTQTYYFLYKNSIDNYVSDVGARNILNGIVKDVLNCFIVHSELPIFVDYQNNGYSLLGLVTETNVMYTNYKPLSFSANVSLPPKYSDSMSSIWYQTQKKHIQLYNDFFNNTLLSKTYYSENLGTTMSSLFDQIKNILVTNNNTSYYDDTNEYSNITLYTMPTNISEIYKAVDTGFDFYRLNISDVVHGLITVFVNDFAQLYSFMNNYYNTNKNILLLKNDGTNLSHNNVTIYKRDFIYETKSVTNDIISNHVLNMYTKTTNITLVNNTTTYINNLNIYGVKDAFAYVLNTFNSFTSDALHVNPFNSFLLHDWYRSLEYVENRTSYYDVIYNLIGNIKSSNLTNNKHSFDNMTDVVGYVCELLMGKVNPKMNIDYAVEIVRISKKYVVSGITTMDNINYAQQITSTSLINSKIEKRLLRIILNEPSTSAWVKELGHKIINSVSVSINDQLIDTHSSELLHFLHVMYTTPEHERGYDVMIGNTQEMYTVSSNNKPIKTLYIPLRFWFCKDVGNALPLINLMYSDVKIDIQTNDLSTLFYTDEDSVINGNPKIKYKLLAQYIYLDEDERVKMASSKLEYLMEKYHSNVKTFSGSDQFYTFEIKMQDPIKYFVWYIKFSDSITEQPNDIINWNEFGYNVRDSNGIMQKISQIFDTIKLKMVGVDREQPMRENQLTHAIPYSKLMQSFNSGEYFYSFSLYPLMLQPSGSCNYSEIDDSVMIIKFNEIISELLRNNSNLKIKMELWGCAYNVIRILGGMGGLAFFR